MQRDEASPGLMIPMTPLSVTKGAWNMLRPPSCRLEVAAPQVLRGAGGAFTSGSCCAHRSHVIPEGLFSRKAISSWLHSVPIIYPCLSGWVMPIPCLLWEVAGTKLLSNGLHSGEGWDLL